MLALDDVSLMTNGGGKISLAKHTWFPKMEKIKIYNVNVIICESLVRMYMQFIKKFSLDKLHDRSFPLKSIAQVIWFK